MAEFTVNQSGLMAQEQPSVIRLPDGRFLFVWESAGLDTPTSFETGIVARVGTVTPGGDLTFGPEVVIDLPQGRNQEEPQVAVMPGGYVAFAWVNYNPNFDGFSGNIEVRTAAISTTGDITLVGLPVVLGQETFGQQRHPQVTTLSNGQLVFTWLSEDPDVDGSGPGLSARIATPGPGGGLNFGNEFTVNQFTANTQSDPQVTELAEGRLLFTWRTPASALQSTTEIAARIGTLSGSAVSFGEEFRVNEFSQGNQFRPQAVTLADGRVFFTWNTADPTFDSTGIAGRIGTVNASGTMTFTGEFPVNETTTSAQSNPQAALLPDGRILVVYQTESRDGSAWAVVGRVGTPTQTGMSFEEEFLINERTTFSQVEPQLAAAPDGRVVVTWTSDDPAVDGAGFGIAAKALSFAPPRRRRSWRSAMSAASIRPRVRGEAPRASRRR